MSEKNPAKTSDADLKFFEEMLIEKRRQLVTAQSDSERASSFQGQKNQAGDGSDSCPDALEWMHSSEAWVPDEVQNGYITICSIYNICNKLNK